MHYQTLTNDQLIDRIKAYKDLPPLSDLQNEALVWLTHSIYRMEVRYISKLVVRKSETAIDVDLLANDATYEFLDRYLIGRHSNLNACEQVLPLLKKIARSKVVNAIRDSRRRCRHPDQTQPDGGRIVPLKYMDSLKTHAGNLPSESLMFDEMVVALELNLNDPILRAVFRLMIVGWSAIEIATRMNWDKRTTHRMLAEVRKSLLPWCESNMIVRNAERNKEQGTRNKEQELSGNTSRCRRKNAQNSAKICLTGCQKSAFMGGGLATNMSHAFDP